MNRYRFKGIIGSRVSYMSMLEIVKNDEGRHLERRLPVSGLESGPACHPERELWIWPDGWRDPKLALRMTGMISKCL
jgi:hypothetical protein